MQVATKFEQRTDRTQAPTAAGRWSTFGKNCREDTAESFAWAVHILGSSSILALLYPNVEMTPAMYEGRFVSNLCYVPTPLFHESEGNCALPAVSSLSVEQFL